MVLFCLHFVSVVEPVGSLDEIVHGSVCLLFSKQGTHPIQLMTN